MANLSSTKICILYPWSRFFSFEILNKLPKAGYKDGLQQLHKFHGIFKEFQNIMVNYLPSWKKKTKYVCFGLSWEAKYVFMFKY